MEWVETTAKTVEEAKDAALDQLGVDEQDAEFEVLEEPRAGLFGRTRGEARVRARVQPTQPRPKVERRQSRSKSDRPRSGGKGGGGSRSKAPAEASAAAPAEAAVEAQEATEVAPAAAPAAVAVAETSSGARGAERRPRGGRGGSGGGRQRSARRDDDDDEGSTDMSETELLEQGEVVKAFLLDLLDAFGLDGEVATSTAEDGALELAVDGADLGLLIGPKGQTLQAIQELSRSALQRQKPGEAHAKIRVDVSGYRERRREALARFTRDIAAQVLDSGERKALEPMSPPDRKVVHDTVNDIDGVTTVSEGEDHRRRVVILPA